MRLAAVLVLAILAGCAGAPPPPATSAPPHLPKVELRGCDNLSGDFPVPVDAAKALLPEGFEPVLAMDAPPMAVLFVVALQCEHGLVDGVDAGPTSVGYEELDVVPPAALRTNGSTDYTVPVFFVAQPAAVGDALAALHLGNAGKGVVTRDAAGFTVTMGGASFTLQGAGGPDGAKLSGGPFGVFGVQKKKLVTTIDASVTDATLATAALAVRGQGAPLLDQARPVARGGAASGFSLVFAPR